MPQTFQQQYPTIGQYTNPSDLLNYYFGNYWSGLLNFLSNFVIAVIIVLVGFLVSYLVEYIIRWLVEKLKINEGLESLGFNKWAERANLKIEVDKFLGRVMFWVTWVVFWMAACDVLGLSSFSQFIYSVLRFLPNAIVAGLIVVGAFFLADFLKKVFYGLIKGAGAKGAEAGSEIIYYVIVVFGIGAALYQLGVAREIINFLIGGVILAFALAFGLAFGLGCQDAARDLVEDIKRRLR
ncbi:MAG: mechanosensitive ion channel family protein [Minisyncoccia bacterium]